MQIDLFKRDSINRDCNRIGNQILTRKFELAQSIAPLDEIESNNSKFLVYRDRVHKLINEQKKPIQVGRIKADSHAELELLGIGKYANIYTVVLDFSDTLDFILAEVSGCRQEAIRGMEGYGDISAAFLNYSFDNACDIDMGKFLDVDPELNRFINSIIMKHQREMREAAVRDIAYIVLTDFYEQVTDFLQRAQNYVARAACVELASAQPVYRSKTLTKVILSSNTPIMDNFEIVGENARTTIIPCSYGVFEYAKRLAVMQ